LQTQPDRKPGPSIQVSTERGDGIDLVGYITIDNPKRLNALDSGLIEQLCSNLAGLDADEDIRALVLTGAGSRAFIGGADIREMSTLDRISARTFIGKLHQACAALREFHAPVIARINGYCLGAGLEIAISCDLRIASEDSVFGMPEVRVGIPSVIEAALLPGLIGTGRSRELVLTGARISAGKALDWGLVERVTPEPGLDRAVQEWIDGILECGPRAIRLQKVLIREWERCGTDEAIERGVDAFAAAYETEEPRRLMEKFLRRRKNGKPVRSLGTGGTDETQR
jgi:enoyl-CoA hydratase